MNAPALDRESVRRSVRLVASLPETSMRSASLVDRLLNMAPPEAVYLLEAIIRGTLQKDPECATIYRVLVDPAAAVQRLGEHALDAMLAAARESEATASLLWLLSPSALHQGDELVAEQLLDKQLRDVTLGQRRSLARRARGDLLKRLLTDPDPTVLAHLLTNPQTTEAEVLQLCSRRPTLSRALESVLQVERWVTRYRVRLAIARNPYLRPTLAINLLPLLTRPDRESLAGDGTLHARVREAAAYLAELGQQDAASWAEWGLGERA